jgi:hypothetical protein
MDPPPARRARRSLKDRPGLRRLLRRTKNGLLRVDRGAAARAHVQLCWLALLLIRVAENATAETWRNLQHELDRMHLVTLATSDGRVAQRSAAPPGQQAIFGALDLREPPRFLDFTPSGG